LNSKEKKEWERCKMVNWYKGKMEKGGFNEGQEGKRPLHVKHVIKRNSEGQKGQSAPHVKLRWGLAKISSFLIVLLDRCGSTHVTKHWYIHHDFMILFKCIACQHHLLPMHVPHACYTCIARALPSIQ
jgi:hypothetical protein